MDKKDIEKRLDEMEERIDRRFDEVISVIHFLQNKIKF